ncbi:MAG: hypothetical protein JXQ81_03005 [Desulfuromonadales bacterium]|nr:hypothetical protein [Desulfuromonadales bacterium]
MANSVEEAAVVLQPVGQIDDLPRVRNVVLPDDAGENGVPVGLMCCNALLLVEPVHAIKAAVPLLRLDRTLGCAPEIGGDDVVSGALVGLIGMKGRRTLQRGKAVLLFCRRPEHNKRAAPFRMPLF